MKAPKARKILTLLKKYGETRNDDYFWLNKRDDQQVLAYLEEENKYTDAQLKDTEHTQEELYQEMKSRYKKDDESLPYYFNHYWYYTRYIKDKELPLFCRKKETLSNAEEVMLDGNQLALNKTYFDINSAAVSLDNRIIAYTYDEVGRRLFTIQFKNLHTGVTLIDKIENTSGKVVWANDNEHIFYIRKDENLRAYQVYRHKLGTDSSKDVLVFHEKDETFDVSLYKTKSQEYIFIASSSTLADEHRYIPAHSINEDWQIIEPRTSKIEYSVEHHDKYFYCITNANHSPNFKLIKTQINSAEKKYWEEVIPHREEVLLEGFEIFKDFLVLEERVNGLIEIKVHNTINNEISSLPFPEPAYSAYIGINLDFDTKILRYGYSSLTTPSSVYEYDMIEKKSTLLKRHDIMDDNFSSDNYISERVFADSRDGKTKIPISLVMHKDTKKSTSTPMLLYAYGSYGHTVDAAFSSVRLSLLDRGFIFAIAHIRGGEYLGRSWYEDGKLLKKKNTFYDFIDASRYFIENEYTSSQHLYAMGGSAGGLLMGAIANQAPKLYNGIIAQVPFVDVVTTMLDASIPLTTGEYDEWGNPDNEEYYHYIKSYSPYDNIVAQDYPNMLITTGYHDSQVQYWEPAKWVAKLRDLKTDDNLLLLKTDMSSGHGGASGRFASLKEDALEYAFLLKLENK